MESISMLYYNLNSDNEKLWNIHSIDTRGSETLLNAWPRRNIDKIHRKKDI